MSGLENLRRSTYSPINYTRDVVFPFFFISGTKSPIEHFYNRGNLKTTRVPGFDIYKRTSRVTVVAASERTIMSHDHECRA